MAATAAAQATAANLAPTPTLSPPSPATLPATSTAAAPVAQNLIDNRGLPYQLEGPPQLVGSQLLSLDAGGLLQIEGTVTNAGGETYSLVKANITFFDGEGQVIHVATGEVQKTPFGPGDVATFAAASSANTADVSTYYVKLEVEQ
ncbi:MAG: hypothetical protein IPK16_17180 [Anaerolineales bacterium]|nr:hypothetical protein [Anaerolineales bacterium]